MKDLTFGEKLAYYGYCILTLGGAWLLKIIIKKAIIESQEKWNQKGYKEKEVGQDIV